jgi:hypothetical protein
MPHRKRGKRKLPQRILALPDLEHATTAVLNSLTSASGQRTYEHAIREFVCAATIKSPGGAARKVDQYAAHWSVGSADGQRRDV